MAVQRSALPHPDRMGHDPYGSGLGGFCCSSTTEAVQDCPLGYGLRFLVKTKCIQSRRHPRLKREDDGGKVGCGTIQSR
jgi:hypothetical protein